MKQNDLEKKICKINNNKRKNRAKTIKNKTTMIKKLFIPNPKQRLQLLRRLQLFNNPKP
jgi:hypothetical protein